MGLKVFVNLVFFLAIFLWLLPPAHVGKKWLEQQCLTCFLSQQEADISLLSINCVSLNDLYQTEAIPLFCCVPASFF